MHSIFDPLRVPDIVALLAGSLLLLKKRVDMERFHKLRAVLLTSLLSSIIIYIFLVYGFTSGHPVDDCCPQGAEVFCQTEM